VFINCPFDERYTQTFRALIFATYACGFRPRSAREADDAGETRIEKLYNLIESCRYGIHDLSRTDLDAATGLPRFNMPFELGIFLGARRYGNANQRAKRALVLDVEPFRYQRFLSDLSGMDIHAHGGDPVRALHETRDWLATVSRRALPSGDRVARLYEDFSAQLPSIARALEFDPGRISYIDFERFAVEWLL
jgi:hypothetical protein